MRLTSEKESVYFCRSVSCSARGASSIKHDAASVLICPDAEGGLTVLSGIAEMGQGGGNVVLQLISEELGVPIETLRLSPLDTSRVPDSGPTTGSRGTITSGNAAVAAAKDLKDKMCRVLSEKWKVDPSEIKFYTGRVYSRRNNLSFGEVITLCLTKMPELCGYARWSLPPVTWDYKNHCGDTYASYNYGACGAEVEIDLISGKVDVTNLVAIHDIGRIINEPEVKGQIAGGASMAMGLALTEEVTVERGIVTALNFNSYLLPTILDFHSFIPVPMEIKRGINPIGVRGIGESSSATVAPAIINAIENALGVRIRCLPANLERVFTAIQIKETEHEQ
jgi:CO/xanthine dehydrogenase Mo-binding subunit